MAVFGKALGNGYAITATIGKREIMEAAQNTFISSNFWSERIGPAAALKTLEVMERTRSWDRIMEIGMKIRKRWTETAGKHKLEIQISGLPSIQSYAFNISQLKYKTLVTQEMLKREFLSTPLLFSCTEHTDEVIEAYAGALDECFGLVKECEERRPVDELLEGPVCHSGFKRLN